MLFRSDAHTAIGVRAPFLVLDQEVADAFLLGKERFRDGTTGMSGVVDRGVGEFGLGLRVNLVVHASARRGLRRTNPLLL